MGIFRFWLALLVAMSHTAGSSMRGNLGASAVIAFYFISGWLMTQSYQAFQGRSSTPSRSFYLDRIIKLYPAFIVVFVLSLAWLVATGHPYLDWRRVAMEPFVFPLAFTKLIPFGQSARTIVPPTWSLGVEACFYIIVPLMIWFSIKTRAVIALALVVVHLTALAMPWTVKDIFPWCGSPLNVGWCNAPFSDAIGFDLPFPIVAVFLLGSIGFEAFKKKTIPPSVFWGIWSLYPLCLWLIFPQIMGLGPNRGPTDALIGNVGTYDALVGASMFFPVVVFLFLLDPMFRQSKLDWWFGQIAYPLFLVHFLAGWIVIRLAGFPADATEHQLKPLYVYCLAAGLLLALLLALFQVYVVDQARYRYRGFGTMMKGAPTGTTDVSPAATATT